jgi:predicted metal-dependent hydrolase
MEEIKYKVVFSRRRTISIIVSPDKRVTVRAPLRASLKKINKFILDHSAWIKKHLNSSPGINLNRNGKKYADGESHLIMGQEYVLRTIESAIFFVRLNDHVIEVGQKDTSNREITRQLLERWYIQKAREILSSKMKEVMTRYNDYKFLPSGLVIRSLKSRWGSCTSKGKITLNSELIKLDHGLIEYVILHELCHLKHHNHGTDFYKLLTELVPDYKSFRKALRRFNTY